MNEGDTMSAVAESGKRSVAAVAGQYLSFFLAGEEYGLEILKVREIIGILPVTRVPRTPRYIRGVINLRGKVIPIIDLRLKLSMDAVEDDRETCIIVVQARSVQMGIVVDQVSEVLDIVESEIEEAPEFGASIDTEYLLGLAKSGGRVRLLLDIEQVLSREEFAALEGAERHGAADEAE